MSAQTRKPPQARTLMLQGTGSDVGKSLITAGLCRYFVNNGLKVAPFKPQNMSNNAAVTSDGGEIGRAQALQAIAARTPAIVDHNPLLLKPETDTGAQVVVQGKALKSLTARDFFKARQQYLPAVLASFNRLKQQNDLVIIEGAGSPAELNLRHGDIANMGFAEAANVPVILVGDIHRGGIIASIAGTYQVISPQDAKRLKGFIINNFHGDVKLFDEGRKTLESLTGSPCLGVVPHFAHAANLPAEDAVALETLKPQGNGRFHICVPRLSRIANFDDLDPLKLEPDVRLEILQPGTPLPATCDLIILPGSKATIADMNFLRQQGWDIDILAHARRGGHVLGICGGFQMLGRTIADPQAIEGITKDVTGLGLLDMETTLSNAKTLSNVSGIHCMTDTALHGYEIHLGETTTDPQATPFAMINGRPEGATKANIHGTYLHGCFASDSFRRAFLARLGVQSASVDYQHNIDKTLNLLAEHLADNIDMEKLLSLAE